MDSSDITAESANDFLNGEQSLQGDGEAHLSIDDEFKDIVPYRAPPLSSSSTTQPLPSLLPFSIPQQFPLITQPADSTLGQLNHHNQEKERNKRASQHKAKRGRPKKESPPTQHRPSTRSAQIDNTQPLYWPQVSGEVEIGGSIGTTNRGIFSQQGIPPTPMDNPGPSGYGRGQLPMHSQMDERNHQMHGISANNGNAATSPNQYLHYNQQQPSQGYTTPMSSMHMMQSTSTSPPTGIQPTQMISPNGRSIVSPPQAALPPQMLEMKKEYYSSEGTSGPKPGSIEHAIANPMSVLIAAQNATPQPIPKLAGLPPGTIPYGGIRSTNKPPKQTKKEKTAALAAAGLISPDRVPLVPKKEEEEEEDIGPPRRPTVGSTQNQWVKYLMQFQLAEPGLETEFSLKACESLHKKIKDKPAELETFVAAIEAKGKVMGGCVPVPRTLDGRLQVAGRKGFPHVIYCKVFRFKDIHKNELRSMKGCRFGFDNRHETMLHSWKTSIDARAKANGTTYNEELARIPAEEHKPDAQVCVNPYHYQKATPQPNPNGNMGIDHSISPRHLQGMQGMNQMNQMNQIGGAMNQMNQMNLNRMMDFGGGPSSSHNVHVMSIQQQQPESTSHQEIPQTPFVHPSTTHVGHQEIPQTPFVHPSTTHVGHQEIPQAPFVHPSTTHDGHQEIPQAPFVHPSTTRDGHQEIPQVPFVRPSTTHDVHQMAAYSHPSTSYEMSQPSTIHDDIFSDAPILPATPDPIQPSPSSSLLQPPPPYPQISHAPPLQFFSPVTKIRDSLANVHFSNDQELMMIGGQVFPLAEDEEEEEDEEMEVDEEEDDDDVIILDEQPTTSGIVMEEKKKKEAPPPSGRNIRVEQSNDLDAHLAQFNSEILNTARASVKEDARKMKEVGDRMRAMMKEGMDGRKKKGEGEGVDHGYYGETETMKRMADSIRLAESIRDEQMRLKKERGPLDIPPFRTRLRHYDVTALVDDPDVPRKPHRVLSTLERIAADAELKDDLEERFPPLAPLPPPSDDEMQPSTSKNGKKKRKGAPLAVIGDDSAPFGPLPGPGHRSSDDEEYFVAADYRFEIVSKQPVQWKPSRNRPWYTEKMEKSRKLPEKFQLDREERAAKRWREAYYAAVDEVEFIENEMIGPCEQFLKSVKEKREVEKELEKAKEELESMAPLSVGVPRMDDSDEDERRFLAKQARERYEFKVESKHKKLEIADYKERVARSNLMALMMGVNRVWEKSMGMTFEAPERSLHSKKKRVREAPRAASLPPTSSSSDTEVFDIFTGKRPKEKKDKKEKEERKSRAREKKAKIMEKKSQEEIELEEDRMEMFMETDYFCKERRMILKEREMDIDYRDSRNIAGVTEWTRPIVITPKKKKEEEEELEGGCRDEEEMMRRMAYNLEFAEKTNLNPGTRPFNIPGRDSSPYFLHPRPTLMQQLGLTVPPPMGGLGYTALHIQKRPDKDVEIAPSTKSGDTGIETMDTTENRGGSADSIIDLTDDADDILDSDDQTEPPNPELRRAMDQIYYAGYDHIQRAKISAEAIAAEKKLMEKRREFAELDAESNHSDNSSDMAAEIVRRNNMRKTLERLEREVEMHREAWSRATLGPNYQMEEDTPPNVWNSHYQNSAGKPSYHRTLQWSGEKPHPNMPPREAPHGPQDFPKYLEMHKKKHLKRLDFSIHQLVRMIEAIARNKRINGTQYMMCAQHYYMMLSRKKKSVNLTAEERELLRIALDELFIMSGGKKTFQQIYPPDLARIFKEHLKSQKNEFRVMNLTKEERDKELTDGVDYDVHFVFNIDAEVNKVVMDTRGSDLHGIFTRHQVKQAILARQKIISTGRLVKSRCMEIPENKNSTSARFDAYRLKTKRVIDLKRDNEIHPLLPVLEGDIFDAARLYDAFKEPKAYLDSFRERFAPEEVPEDWDEDYDGPPSPAEPAYVTELEELEAELELHKDDCEKREALLLRKRRLEERMQLEMTEDEIMQEEGDGEIPFGGGREKQDPQDCHCDMEKRRKRCGYGDHHCFPRRAPKEICDAAFSLWRYRVDRKESVGPRGELYNFARQYTCPYKFEIKRIEASAEPPFARNKPKWYNWCAVGYHERDELLNELTQIHTENLIIDGGFEDHDDFRICIRAIPNELAEEDVEVQYIRDRIGGGIRLSVKEDGSMWIRSMSGIPIFISAPYLDREQGGHMGASVHKLYPGCSAKVFDLHRARRIMMQMFDYQHEAYKLHLNKKKRADLPYPLNTFNRREIRSISRMGSDDMQKFCIVRLGFGCGWGPEYRYKAAYELPCWVEIILNRGCEFMDHLLNLREPIYPYSDHDSSDYEDD